MSSLTEVSRYVSEIANQVQPNNQPFGYQRLCPQGRDHASAVLKAADTYEHINPELVGNKRRILVSELSEPAI